MRQNGWKFEFLDESYWAPPIVTFKGIRQIIYVLILDYRQTDERLPHKSFVFTFVSNAQ